MEDRVLRERQQAAGLMVIGLGVLVVFVSWAALMEESSWPTRLATSAIGAVIGGSALVTGMRARVVAHSTGITIVNPIETVRIRWEEIRQFSLGRYGPYPRMGLVEKVDGTFAHIWAIQAPNPLFRPKNRRADRIIRELDALLVSARARSNQMRPEQEG